MPIKEDSFRIGCGRYMQGAGYIEKIGEEIRRVGSSPLLLGGAKALALAREELVKSVSAVCNKYEFIVHKGTCNDEQAKEIASYAKKEGYDVIVGVGGGVLCDFSKLCAHFANTPVINLPTSSATCAAYTPLSVRYTKDGKTVGSLHYDHEVNCVIADTAIIAAQPVRLFLAGIFDAMAKFIEIKHRFTEETLVYPLGLDYAYAMSKRSYRLLREKTQTCIDAMQQGTITNDVETMIFTTIAATGVISGIARGSNQVALAHKFYETTRYLFPQDAKTYLHGEIVGIGLLLQNHFNGEMKDNDALLSLMKTYKMPHCVTDIGVDTSEKTFQAYYHHLCDSGSIDKESAAECQKLRESLSYLWSLNDHTVKK